MDAVSLPTVSPNAEGPTFSGGCSCGCCGESPTSKTLSEEMADLIRVRESATERLRELEAKVADSA